MGRKSVWIKAEFSFCSPLFIPLFSTCCPHVFLIFLHYVFHMMWIIFIKYQYKKYRNIFFYVFSLYFSLLMFYQCGTVFQTALTVLARLRLSRHVQNLSRITLMRRICSFHGFFSFGFVCACRALGSSRIYLSLWTICGLLLLYAIQRRTGANTIRRKSKTK